MPFIVACAALAGSAWALWFVLRGSLVAGALAYVVAVACLGGQFWNGAAGPIPVTIDRAILALLTIAYVVQRKLGRCDPKPWTKVEWLIFAMLGVFTASMLGTDWRNPPPRDVSAAWRLIGGYVQPAMVYYIVRQAAITRRDLRMLQYGFTLLGVYLGFTGVCEAMGWWAFVTPKFIADPTLGLHFGRARGPMVQSISFGHYLDVCLLAAWLWCVRAPRVGKLALVSLAPLMLAGIYVSYTRSVWIGGALGLAAALAMSLSGAWRKAVIGVALAGGVLAVAGLDQIREFRREGAAADTRSSADVRTSFAYVSWLMFVDRPAFGFGFGEFPQAKLPYLADRTTDLQLEPMRHLVHHNTYLSILTETGIVGFLPFAGLLLAWSATSLRLWRRSEAPLDARLQATWTVGAIAVYSVQALFHELSYTPIDNSLLFLIAGVTAGLSAAADRSAIQSHLGAVIARRQETDGLVGARRW